MLIEFGQHPVRRQHPVDTRFGLTAFADGGHELAMLAVDTVVGHLDVREVHRFVPAGSQVVVEREIVPVSPM
jgi:hypothetical protein